MSKNFIGTLVDSIFSSSCEDIKKMAVDISKNYVSNWCIGSGSNFVIYENLSLFEAYKIFVTLPVRMCFGSLIYKKSFGTTKVESFHCMESNSGHTEVFIFEVDINKNEVDV